MSLKIYKQNYLPKINYSLETFLKETKDSLPTFSRITLEVYDKLKQLTIGGGKRLRPLLAMAGYELIKPGTELSEDLLDLAVSLELFQTFCLIHDDIIDQADTRRGMVTTHTHFAPKFRSNAKHMGVSAAILAGDFAYALCVKKFSDIVSRNSNPIFQNYYCQMQFEVQYGQTDDVLGLTKIKLSDLRNERITNMMDYKSGRYSIQKPLLLGASLAKAKTKDIRTLEILGKRLGIVFQITDDILGIFGETEIMGKSNYSDLEEGKRTLLISKTYTKLTYQDQQKMESIMEQSSRSTEDCNWLKDKIKETEVKQELETFCEDEIAEIKLEFSQNFAKSQALDFVLDVCDYIQNRQK